MSDSRTAHPRGDLISDLPNTHDDLVRHAGVSDAVIRILSAGLTSRSEPELAAACVEIATEVTGSTFGFISDAGFSGGAFFTSDPEHHSVAEGAPEGHPRLSSLAAAPLLSGGVAVGAICVANKPGGYDDHDVDSLGRLAGAVEDSFVRFRERAELNRSKQLLDAHMERSPLATIEFDPDFRVTRWSNMAEKTFGYSADEILGRSIAEMKWVYEEDIPLVEAESNRLATGGRPLGANLNRNYRKDGSVIWCEWYSSAIYDDDGRMLSVLSRVLDVTERLDSQRFAEASADIDQLLHSSLSVAEIMDCAVRVATEALGADQGVINSVEGDHFVVSHVFGWPPETRGQCVPADEAGPDVLALSSKKPVVSDDAMVDERFDRDYMAAWGIGALISVPMISRGDGVAALNITFTQPHRFSANEIAFAKRLGTSLSLALDNARLYETEHDIAETLQETLIVLPTHLRGVEFSRAYESATAERGRVGGDFVDIFEIGRDLVAMAIGDVSGKGIDAAVTTSLVRNTLRVHAIDGLSPADVAVKTNQVVRRFTSLDTFVTVFFGVMNTRNGLLRYICAGHPAPMIMPANGDLWALQCPAPILGAFEDITFAELRTVVASHDRIVLYSDGITEARGRDGIFFDSEGLERALEKLRSVPTSQLAERILVEVGEFSGGVLRDDAAVLVVEPTGISALKPEQPRLDI